MNKLSDYLFELPPKPPMRVPARIYATEKMLKEIANDRSLWQLSNIATLPGIQKYAIAMPDMHEGYGFPIGGVAAMDEKTGVISPGGVGYDINCGIRLLVSSLSHKEIREVIPQLTEAIYRSVPSGVGRGGDIKLNPEQIKKVLEHGVKDLVANNYGTEEDLARIEEEGSMAGAKAENVSETAKKRGRDQLGTLGSGNHFIEIQRVEKIYDHDLADKLGIFENQITVLIHTGSRGLGHQVCTDYVRLMVPKLKEWGIELPDRELACAPIDSPEGQKYLSAMAAAANFAWANRQLITWRVRRAWAGIMAKQNRDAELKIIYDVAHNIAKREKHWIDGKEKWVWVHRKGATRAFGPGREEIQTVYREIGQPVLIPGTMGTASYVLVGTETAMQETFGTVCHGAGRRMSRGESKRRVHGANLRQELQKQGIVIFCDSSAGLAEEAPLAYKDVDEVVEVVHQAGLARKVARLKPLGVVKGG